MNPEQHLRKSTMGIWFDAETTIGKEESTVGRHSEGVKPPIDSATPTQSLALVEDLLARTSFALNFPGRLEDYFQSAMLDRRIKNFVRLSSVGLIVYDLFIFTDYFMMPDIIGLIISLQIAIVTPILMASLFAIHCRFIKPDVGIVACQFLILSTILVFYHVSRSPHADLLIFTVSVSLAFGNVVLPLPFRWSVLFTLISIGSSVISVTTRQGGDSTTTAFVILTQTTIGLFFLFSTYRGEKSERQTFLFNLRERFRADVLAENNKKLKNLSEIDGLTGVYNRRHFDEVLDRLWYAGMNAAEPVALFIIDIDHFKRLNDTFGHQEGDRCLRAVAQCVQAHLVPNAILARYGGEEFVVLLSGVNPLYARSCAEVLRSAVGRLGLISEDGSPLALTVSIGISSMIPTSTLRSGVLMTEADQALYRAKANGRDRVESATPQAYDAARVSPIDREARFTA